MKIAIVGYGREGRSSYNYFSKNKDNDITICDADSNIKLDKIKSNLGSHYLDNMDQYDLIVRSSGINPNLIIKDNHKLNEKITTQLNLFLDKVNKNNVIGITGTKGKGTTSTLIYKILIESGFDSVLAGNIGIPFLDVLDKLNKDTLIVLELSSFQLADLKAASPHIAVCLMVSEDHLNWHGSLSSYIEAKTNLFINQNTQDIAIFNAKNKISENIVNNSPANEKIPYLKNPGAFVQDETIKIGEAEICKTDNIKLLGNHNLENICAAITATWQITKDVSSIQKVLSSFNGLEHRLEFVKEINNVKYYNDSFASNLSATTAAIEAISGKIVLIIGGFERNLDLSDFTYFIKENEDKFRKIQIIGESSKRVKIALDSINFSNYLVNQAKDINLIVREAQGLAKSGDSVVLSPGFASFDMFKDFEERGNKFKEAVNSL